VSFLVRLRTYQHPCIYTHTQFAYLHIPALGNFCEVFLVLQCFVLSVVRHTEYSQPCFHEIHTLCKHHKSGDQNEDIWFRKAAQICQILLEHCVQSGMCHLCAAQYKIINPLTPSHVFSQGITPHAAVKQPIYKNSWRWTCKCPKHVEAIYEKKS